MRKINSKQTKFGAKLKFDRIEMADNNGANAEEIIDEEDEKYNYYECKYNSTKLSSICSSVWYQTIVKKTRRWWG